MGRPLTSPNTPPANATHLHHDPLGSVRAITNPAGARVEATVYKPYGERVATVVSLQPESKGWLGWAV